MAAENGLEQEAAMLNAPTASDTYVPGYASFGKSFITGYFRIRTEERESNELSSRLAALRNWDRNRSRIPTDSQISRDGWERSHSIYILMYTSVILSFNSFLKAKPVLQINKIIL